MTESAESAAPTTSTTLLEIRGLSHAYGGKSATPVLSGVDLAVAAGELVCVVGPSGCGKSTMLRACAGLLRPDGGTVTLDGEPVDGVPRGIAVVFQEYGRSLYPWMRVLGNVELPLLGKGTAKRERRETARAALADVGLAESAHSYPWQLSGGMQQRVALARALAARPRLLLMDEPFGSVDAQTREDLEDLLLRVRAEHGVAVLLITHDIDEAVYLGDRVAVMRPGPGRIVADLPVPLPRGRDQTATRESAEFVRLRGRVSRLIRAAAPDSADVAP